MSNFEITHSKPFAVDLKNIDRNMQRGIRQGFFKVGSLLKKTAKDSMTEKPKSGRLYRIKGRNHRASAAGESPANLSGELRKSIGFGMQGYKTMQFGAGGRGSGVDYASYLERGTKRMKERPLLQNAVEDNEGSIDAIFKDAVSRTLATPLNQPVVF